MKLLDKKPKKEILNTTPLMDMMFILIIFFAVTSTFLDQPGIKLELPKAQTSEAQQKDKTVIYISQDSKLFLQNKEVTLENLPAILRDIMQNRADKNLVISADKDVPHGLVVQVMDIARASKVEKLVISTEPE